jgi:hypothetical protein
MPGGNGYFDKFLGCSSFYASLSLLLNLSDIKGIFYMSVRHIFLSNDENPSFISPPLIAKCFFVKRIKDFIQSQRP